MKKYSDYKVLNERVYKNSLLESFEMDDWLVQERDNPIDNIYGKVVGFTKNGITKVMVMGGSNRKPVNQTLTGWNPSPKLINVKDVPAKIVKKIEDKLS